MKKAALQRGLFSACPGAEMRLRCPGRLRRGGYSSSRGVYFIGTPVDEGAGFPSIV